MMLSAKKTIYALLVVLSIVAFTGCTKMAESHLRVNPSLVTPFTMPAEAYLAIASHQMGEEKQNLLLMAAGRYIFDGQWQKGDAILQQNTMVTIQQKRQRLILLAKIAMLRQNPKQARFYLADVHGEEGLSLFYALQYHELLASSYHASGNLTDAIHERMQLERLLPDEPSRMGNRRILWLMLNNLSKIELTELLIESKTDTVWQGWLSLAAIARDGRLSSDELYQEISVWQRNYPGHPANGILPQPLERIRPYLMPKPERIGVLLPLSGSLSGPGNAIKDGILQAKKVDHLDSISIRFYDTAQVQAGILYQKAIEEGAQYIIGPLTKPDVLAVSRMSHPVPTLLLNDIHATQQPNVYQFGLSLPNEAEQVAVKARQSGLSKALIIAPQGIWGDEIVQAFQRQWTANGGTIADIYRFDNKDNVSEKLRFLLHAVKDSSIKKGEVIPLESKRRQDVDMIFLLAYPSKARQIMPILKYYYAGNIPVYSTSTVYAGTPDRMNDKDLDGIILCDMPWVFQHDKMVSRQWSELLNSYNRLYAMGFDSMQLVYRLNYLLMFPALGLSESSGILYMAGGQRIARILSWGQFRDGLLSPLQNQNE